MQQRRVVSAMYLPGTCNPSTKNINVQTISTKLYKLPIRSCFTSLYSLLLCLSLIYDYVNLSSKCKVNTGFDFTGDDYKGTGNLFNFYILPVDSIQRFTAHSLLCVQYPQIRRN